MSSPSHPRRRSPAFMPFGIKAISCGYCTFLTTFSTVFLGVWDIDKLERPPQNTLWLKRNAKTESSTAPPQCTTKTHLSACGRLGRSEISAAVIHAADHTEPEPVE